MFEVGVLGKEDRVRIVGQLQGGALPAKRPRKCDGLGEETGQVGCGGGLGERMRGFPEASAFPEG